jgi:uncharacterized protein involved in response to NO
MPAMFRTLFSIAFRPFFLAAGWFSAAWILIWVFFLMKGVPSLGTLNPILWHGHEMLFGFAAAVIAGFALTAVQNWTGLTSATPASLAALVLLWLTARLGFLLPGIIPLWFTSVVDLVFFPALAWMMARVLFKAKNRNNYILLPVFAGFALLNLAIHLEIHGLAHGAGMPALQGTVYLVVLLLVFMGGRVIPYFTSRRLPDLRVRQWPWLDGTTLVVTLAVLPGFLWLGKDPILAPLLLAAAMLNLLRLLAWRPWGAWRVPLLWVLHVSYLWLPIGFALHGAHLLGAPVPWSSGVHALMVGALGGLTVGMMARVSLGHTGRPLEAHPVITLSFALVALAALARLAMTFFPVSAWLLIASAMFWAAAFAIFATYYTPILLTPRRN